MDSARLQFVRYVVLPALGLTHLIALAILLRMRVGPRLCGLLGVACLSIFGVWVVFCVWTGHSGFFAVDGGDSSRLASGWDFEVFWKAGRVAIEGGNPYAMGTETMPFLYPPNVIPLAKLFGAAPIRFSLNAWLVVNSLIAACLVPLACRVLAEQRGGARAPILLPTGVGVALASYVCMNPGTLLGIGAGQFSLLAAVGLLGALLLQARNRPALAGLCLAVGAVKAATTLPFLLLFCRKSDLPAWATLSAATLGLCLASGPVGELPGRLRGLPAHVARYGAPGELNDYANMNEWSCSMIGFDHAFYRAGLRDRESVRRAQAAALLVLVGALALEILWLKSMPRDAEVAVVAAASLLVLYHRYYDAVILVAPFLYSVHRARIDRGWRRWCFVASGLCCMAILDASNKVTAKILTISQQSASLGPFLRVVVLPYAAWLSCAIVVLIWVAARRPSVDESAPAASA